MRRQLGLRVRESKKGAPDSYLDIEEAYIETMPNCYLEKEDGKWREQGEIEESHRKLLEAYAKSFGKKYVLRQLPDAMEVDFEDGSSLISQVVPFPLYQNKTIDELEMDAWSMEEYVRDVNKELQVTPKQCISQIEELTCKKEECIYYKDMLDRQIFKMKEELEEKEEEEELPFT